MNEKNELKQFEKLQEKERIVSENKRYYGILHDSGDFAIYEGEKMLPQNKIFHTDSA